MDRRWFPARKCKRDDTLGTWPCVDAQPPDPRRRRSSRPRPQFAKTGDPRIDRLAPSLVMVNFDMPYSVSGVTEKNYHGTGVIVDAQRGLVAIDRNTVPVAMGDVRITFAGTVEVPGKVVFIHPLHNLAVVSYDPKSIGTTPVRAATLVTKALAPGEDVWVVGRARRFENHVAEDPDLQRRCGRVSAVAHPALPRQQSGGGESHQPAGRLRRRAGGREGQCAGAVVEFRVRDRSANSSRSIAAFRRSW